MMRGRIVVCALIVLIALMGCTPTGEAPISPDAGPATETPSPMPSTTPSPTSAAFIPMTPNPSRTPVPDFRVIDMRPLDLILTLDELGLEETYSLSFDQQHPNDEFLDSMPSWEEMQKWQEWLEESGRITGWYVWYEFLELGDNDIMIWIDIYRTTLGRL